ncbi:glycyl-tRNA synthetase, tetrameric type, beta subunit [Desulfosporosinus orientis DSM 765]|uniref:Glycine--tRNA ligase beta subunit n=1 Tax=Desulfosporosinus orientis (strain ATCC 19365 / DSM 765 / NCIMB 8382 / VKM B-1628 / Singapore I) TaxID=768706 RepID=G7WJ69_DESOD|nr:glycine--tRNA ligase subunit beta [Desulfosporosinus orientis]AET70381.1 glycyl-tRNA synthetase, tetrameric type, beta subunit [Desulfosporosinus orientis DSM 765]
MAKDFLLEIGTEEIPAKFSPGAMAQLEEQAGKRFAELRLTYQEIKAFATPRRLTLMVMGLAERQEDLSMEVKGPAVKAAYDAKGEPTKAAQGFARGQGVPVESLFTQEINGIPYVFARKSEVGLDTAALLPQVAVEIIGALHFPKPMRWGELDFRFARPIRWIVALYGSEVIPFEFVGLKSGRVSRGHRTLSVNEVIIEKPSDYPEALRKAFVIIDPEERKASILAQIKTLADQVGGQVPSDEELLGEVIHLVEYPTALLGEVAPQYMHLPEAVITTPMREHQRYFPLRAENGKLLPYFITVRNGNEFALDKVRVGNEKVLKARLEDAAFYYREDQKVSLADLVPKLGKIVYHEKLGTVEQRVERLRGLSKYLAEQQEFAGPKKDDIDRTAYLAKADLVTLMVGDFPELQGIMGADYAKASGEKPEVCQGILEHYQPRFAGDETPASDPGRVVSIADKMDAIVGAFSIGIQPTGSQDPYALRRQAQGIVGILLESGWNLSLTELFRKSYSLFEKQGTALLPIEDILPSLQDFFQQRVRFVLQEQGLRYDTVDAVLAFGCDDINRVVKKARVLSEKRVEEAFVLYAQSYTRCFNLTKKEVLVELDASRLVDQTELALAQSLSSRRERFEHLMEVGNYEEAYDLAWELVPQIEALFQAVMIMVEDKDLKNMRLALLGQCVVMLGCLGELSLLA